LAESLLPLGGVARSTDKEMHAHRAEKFSRDPYYDKLEELQAWQLSFPEGTALWSIFQTGTLRYTTDAVFMGVPNARAAVHNWVSRFLTPAAAGN